MKRREKTIILVRHAHRDTANREANNGLSAQGKKQSLKLCKELQEIFDLKELTLVSSPKLRCTETLSPLAKVAQTEIRQDPRLLELQADEPLSELKKRMVDFLKDWNRSSSKVTVVCSHGDWLTLAMRGLLEVRSEFKKAGWAEIFLVDKKPVLKFRPHG